MPYVYDVIVIIVPVALATLSYCELTRWLGVHRAWMLVCCTVLAIIVAMCSDSGDPNPIVMRLVQFAVPLSVGWWAMRRGGGESTPVKLPVIAIPAAKQAEC